MFYQNLIENEKNTSQEPFTWKWTGPIVKSGEGPFGLIGVLSNLHFNENISPTNPLNENGLVQLIRVGNSILLKRVIFKSTNFVFR